MTPTPAIERSVTFVVRVVESSAGVHAVIERVRTGRKQRVDRIDAIGPAIAAMALGDEDFDGTSR